MMKTKMSNVLRAKLGAAMKTDEFWMESAKLDFALAIEQQRRRIDMSYADVAAAIKTSPAYISKVFRGDANLTIESMVKLARSLGCNLDFVLKEIVEDGVIESLITGIQSARHTFNKNTLAEFMAEDGGVRVGRFNLPKSALIPNNDQMYQDAA